MAERESLVRVIQRLAVDEEFRHRMLNTPREVVMAELGISGETYQALVSLVPVLLAGGLFILAGGGLPGTEGIDSPGWGGWG
jgi:hypothetical protein